MLDRGLSLAEVEGLVETAGECVDIVKLGWGTAVVSENLRPKLERYAAHGIPVVLGGTLTELAVRQAASRAWSRGWKSWGCATSRSRRHRRAGARGQDAPDPHARRRRVTVLAEVGSKDAAHIMAPYVWVELIERDLQAGAWKVIAEARESGTAGIYRADGEVRSGLIDEIAHAVDPDRLIFEAPRKEQQVWLLDFFGSECNLGNIAPGDVLSLETLRLGLRSDTVERFALGGQDWGDELRPPKGGSAGRRSHGETGQAQRLARVVFAVLVVACFAAFVATQRLKHTPTPVQEFKMDEAFIHPRAGGRLPRRVPARLVNASDGWSTSRSRSRRRTR